MEFLFSSSHFKSIYNIHMSSQHTIQIYYTYTACKTIAFEFHFYYQTWGGGGVSLGNYTTVHIMHIIRNWWSRVIVRFVYRIPYKVYYKVFDMFTKIQIISYIHMYKYILENSYSNSLLSFSYLDKFSIWIVHLYIFRYMINQRVHILVISSKLGILCGAVAVRKMTGKLHKK